MIEILNHIAGEDQKSRSGRWLEKDEPAKGRAFLKLPDSDSTDVDAALTAASVAAPAWAKTSVHERAKILWRLADLIEAHQDQLAKAEAQDSGKPLSLARNIEIPRAAANFRFFASAITQFHGESFVGDKGDLHDVVFEPLGVVACISPWNLPLYLLTWKLAPALAAGNAVVAKPSEVTPWTASLLAGLAKQAGLPPGVLNIVHGTGPKVGAPLVADSRVKAVSFTGSTATGRAIAQATVGSFKKLSLEMGGKNANIIFADADFESALAMTLRSSFQNQGQICLCGSRILIEKSIYEKFRDELVVRTKALRLGDPLDEKTEQGALVSRPHWEKVRHHLALAKQEGGRLLCGGEVPALGGDLASGYFLEPTLFEGLGPQTQTNQEEIFGPVATLIPFENEDEALRLANSTRYGLAASLWTQDQKRALRVARGLHSGMVWINTWMSRDLRTPFGGVKESGYGREGGMDALKFFTESKTITWAGGAK